MNEGKGMKTIRIGMLRALIEFNHQTEDNSFRFNRRLRFFFLPQQKSLIKLNSELFRVQNKISG